MELDTECCYTECDLYWVSFKMNITYKPFMLIIIMLNIVLLSAVILSVIMLDVVAPFQKCFIQMWIK
jgi:hypothetical protein